MRTKSAVRLFLILPVFTVVTVMVFNLDISKESAIDRLTSPLAGTLFPEDSQLLSPSLEYSRTCSMSWGTFQRNHSNLTETQVIPRSFSPPPFNISTFDSSFYTLFVHPKSNFAFCAIPKNGCTQWQTVLRNVMDGRENLGHSYPDFYLGNTSRMEHGIDAIKKIFESPTSTVAVMVRDPLARFASAYLDKCFDKGCRNRYCLWRDPSRDGEPISFRQVMQYARRVDLSIIDYHWRLQSELCGLKDGGLDRYYSIVGKMTKETLAHDAACIMEMAGIEKHNIAPLERNGTFWRAEDHHTSAATGLSEKDLLRKLYTPATARLLMKAFQQDYDTFQLPEPEWVVNATGEWIDSVDHHPCRPE